MARSVGRTDGRTGSPTTPEMTSGVHRQVSAPGCGLGWQPVRARINWLDKRCTAPTNPSRIAIMTGP
jgi:hypothetical protein